MASELIQEHLRLGNTPLAILAAQCNKLVSGSPTPPTNTSMDKDFNPWKKGSTRKSSASPDPISHPLTLREREASLASTTPFLETYQRPTVSSPSVEPYGAEIRLYQGTGSQPKVHHSDAAYFGNIDSRMGTRTYDTWTPFNMAPGPAHTAMKSEMPTVSSFNPTSWWDMHPATTASSWLGMPSVPTSLPSQHPDSYPTSAGYVISPTLAASHSVGHAVTSPFGLGQSFLPQIPSPRSQKRYSGRATCACPNCVELEKLGGTGAHLRKASVHSCHIPGCGKVYAKSSHLKAHLRWHTNERTFVCDWLFCGKRFTRSDELQRHAKTHTAEERFVCPMCNQRFAQSNSLAKHMKIHNGDAKKSANIRVCSDSENSQSEIHVTNAPPSLDANAISHHHQNGVHLEKHELSNGVRVTK